MSTKRTNTKYGNQITRNSRWQWDHKSGNPNLTKHALERYDQRTPAWSSSPEHAWTNGIDVTSLSDYLIDKGGQTPEEARYYAETTDREWFGVLLLVRDSSIVTCYSHRSLQRLDHGRALQAFLVMLAAGEGWV